MISQIAGSSSAVSVALQAPINNGSKVSPSVSTQTQPSVGGVVGGTLGGVAGVVAGPTAGAGTHAVVQPETAKFDPGPGSWSKSKASSPWMDFMWSTLQNSFSGGPWDTMN